MGEFGEFVSKFPENCDCPGDKGPCFFPPSSNSHFPNFLHGQIPFGQTYSMKDRAEWLHSAYWEGSPPSTPTMKKFPRGVFYTTYSLQSFEICLQIICEFSFNFLDSVHWNTNFKFWWNPIYLFFFFACVFGICLRIYYQIQSHDLTLGFLLRVLETLSTDNLYIHGKVGREHPICHITVGTGDLGKSVRGQAFCWEKHHQVRSSLGDFIFQHPLSLQIFRPSDPFPQCSLNTSFLSSRAEVNWALSRVFTVCQRLGKTLWIGRLQRVTQSHSCSSAELSVHTWVRSPKTISQEVIRSHLEASPGFTGTGWLGLRWWPDRTGDISFCT